MHLVAPDRITVVPGVSAAGMRYVVEPLPADRPYLDVTAALLRARNDRIDPRPDPKLRSAQYPAEAEIAAYETARARADGTLVAPVSVGGVLATAAADYRALGYFVESLNRYVVPDDAPYRIGVAVENLLYSYKDVYSYPRAGTVIPPLREPSEARACIAGVNAGTVCVVLLPDDPELAASCLRSLVALEKIAPRTLAAVLRLPAGSGTMTIDVPEKVFDVSDLENAEK